MLSTTSINNIFLKSWIFGKKTLLCCSYNPHKSNVSSHLISLGQTLDIQMTRYDNFLIVGYPDSELSEFAIDTFEEMHYLHNLVKSATW